MNDDEKILYQAEQDLLKMPHLSKEEAAAILDGYRALQIRYIPSYSDPYQFSRDMQKASNLQYEGLIFSMSGSTIDRKV